eukprot:364707-Chlamydomonas_euryale.AAC.25
MAYIGQPTARLWRACAEIDSRKQAMLCLHPEPRTSAGTVRPRPATSATRLVRLQVARNMRALRATLTWWQVRADAIAAVAAETVWSRCVTLS